MGLKKKVEPIADVSDDFEEKREHPRTKEQLISDLNSSDSDVRRWAVRDLSGQKDAHDAFIYRLPQEDDPTVIEALFSALEHDMTQSHASQVITMLKSEHVQLRNGAIELMQQNPDIFAANVNLLMHDEDPDTRIFCVDIIGAVAHIDAVNWLHQFALNDDNENVVGTALDKLAEIADVSTLDILQTVESRFPNHNYIQFVISLIRNQVRNADE
ncbi:MULTISPECIES: HEAT repeat domain-containing protein [Alteromonas]|jgi:HEAT repeat protein|uniref:PBS lyase HEAT-like repeat protein n=1 Tax=Alteromonas macleodii (strain English Channel 673) TaxID=1004788 RepID=A0AB33A1F3_ALTME|nr:MULTISPECIES: HEAT repeat domain-containing protein [Alteromonas]MCG8497016.1 HEAT repeat domain-containing protein [Enterobacterales bacterium]MCH2256667.1 HEAT repeat domain-containing protein [Alteromonas sp.]MED5332703.1 HEAT repeat domain-containing protein [Pseudomonadota bacterium]AFS38329.1 PBS lyase HEAT-like repeat protein [Alteromonas macleodii ATCC 27126]AFT75572.1 PBS lyase HEAT-like repeat protein [Alteromonas macleodii str. 'English Channel 673']|tara:strand:- start:6608 stop:7249 length:642 start_codon:yes stop_codon:yes gene_type:complete